MYLYLSLIINYNLIHLVNIKYPFSKFVSYFNTNTQKHTHTHFSFECCLCSTLFSFSRGEFIFIFFDTLQKSHKINIHFIIHFLFLFLNSNKFHPFLILFWKFVYFGVFFYSFTCVIDNLFIPMLKTNFHF